MGDQHKRSEDVIVDEPCTPPACKRPRVDQKDLTSVRINQSDLSIIRTDQSDLISISDQLLAIEHRMCEELNHLGFSPPVTHIYNPLDYAAETHRCYIHRYGNSKKRVLFLGMNPGPFGMAQNGVGELLCPILYTSVIS